MALADFVNEKLEVASALAAGKCGGTYVDAAIIVAALLSGIASEVWPGLRNDRQRFIELWATFGEPETLRVSVPLLTQTLRLTGSIPEAEAIEAMHADEFFWPGSARVLVGNDVDLAESDIQAVCTKLTHRELRRHSYPALFYSQVRCASVHEYEIGEEASARAMTSHEAAVSYLNRIEPESMTTRRLIHFHMPWLIDFVGDVAARVDGASAPARPTTWWIDA